MADKMITVTKFSAARSQLETAILLWFNEADPVAIHTLAVAAQDCYKAIAKHSYVESAFERWVQSQPKSFQKQLHDAQNFFKHGPDRLKGTIRLMLRHAEVLMVDAVRCHNLAIKDFPPLMWLYAVRFAVENPTLASVKIAPFINKSIDVYKIGDVPRKACLEQILPVLNKAVREGNIPFPHPGFVE